MSYLGVPPFGQTVRTITELTASAGQTTFSPSGGYLPGYIDVFLNGSALGAADFTATNGSTVVLNVAAALNDEFKAIAYWPVSLIDTYRKAEADALLAARVGTTSSVSMRNRIINGDMRIDQRNAGAAVTANNDVFLVDRFQMVATQTSKFTAQRNAGAVTPPAGFSNYMGFTSSSAYALASGDIFAVRHKIEGFNVADLAWGTASAQPVTVSFWVRSSLVGTFGGAIENQSSNRCYPFSYSISVANTWEQKTVTVSGDTTGAWEITNGTGMQLAFGLGVGSTSSGTAGSWGATRYWSTTGATSVVGTSGATFYITGVQLEAGTVATPFERRDYGRELMMCQRYYARGAHYALLPAGASNVLRRDEVRLPVTMRTNPTVTFNENTTFGNVYRNSSVAATIFNTDADAFRLQTSSGGGTTQDDMFFNWFVSAEL